ncbi:MAG: Stp1/IreP family PP2C-type Ser/Thr phosphatase [Deltaproteobacteria bacterium]|nr:Stp1/IreP family PP2C-type Ser/Thr phosphatase [Deltaproteobacteria bacterium]
MGRMRSVNEDSCDSYVRPDGARLLVVADGMGGHRGGATASREAVAAIGETFEQRFGDGASPDPGETLVEAIEQANARIHALSRQDPELAGMGTTVVALLLDRAGRAAIAHVGDSRCYRFRDRRLEPLTVDHSVVAEMLRRGVLTAEEAANHPRRNEILRSVGVLRDVDVELTPLELAPGDWILLCSDGLCGVVSDAEIDLVLANASSPEAAVEDLIRLANDSGGPDNVTVQILAVGDDWRADPNAPPLAWSGRAAAGGSGSTSPGGSGAASVRSGAADDGTRLGEVGAPHRSVSAEPGPARRAVLKRALFLAALAALAWWLLGGR